MLRPEARDANAYAAARRAAGAACRGRPAAALRRVGRNLPATRAFRYQEIARTAGDSMRSNSRILALTALGAVLMAASWGAERVFAADDGVPQAGPPATHGAPTDGSASR